MSITLVNNKLYLTILQIICKVYEKLYTFKSNSNFWSGEIYIVGINKMNMSTQINDIMYNGYITELTYSNILGQSLFTSYDMNGDLLEYTDNIPYIPVDNSGNKLYPNAFSNLFYLFETLLQLYSYFI